MTTLLDLLHIQESPFQFSKVIYNVFEFFYKYKTVFKNKIKLEKKGKTNKQTNKHNEDHIIWSHQFMANRWGNNGNHDRI